jgi:hypothetical protein
MSVLFLQLFLATEAEREKDQGVRIKEGRMVEGWFRWRRLGVLGWQKRHA